MEANPWAQEVGGMKAMEEIAPSTSSRPVPSSERKVIRPQKDQVLNCPRCQSTNTKFCYYNNYSLNQPRYFCKTCRRYWTEGGTLRNVPVGGGSRKNRRSSSSSSSSASTRKIPDANLSSVSQFSSQYTNKIHEAHDLNLSFPYSHECHFPPQNQLFEFPRYESGGGVLPEIKPSSSASTPFAALELLRNGFASSGGMLPSHITGAPGPSSNAMYHGGFSFQDLKPSLSFSVDRFGSSRYGSNGIQMHDQENNEKPMFPLEAAVKQNPGSGDRVDGQNKEQQISNGCWSGMLGGGAW